MGVRKKHQLRTSRQEESEEEEAPPRVTRAMARQHEDADEAGHGGDGEDGVSESSAPDDVDDVPQSEEGEEKEEEPASLKPAHHRHSNKKRTLSTGAARTAEPKRVHPLYMPRAADPEAPMPAPAKLMQISLRVRKQPEDWGNLPMLELSVKTTASVMELHRAIHSQCPQLPPEAQQLYVQNGVTSDIVSLDPWGTNGEFMLLSDYGLVQPGNLPRTVWAELDTEQLARLTGVPVAAPAAPAPAPGLRTRPIAGPQDDGSDWLHSAPSTSAHRDEVPAQPAEVAAQRSTLALEPVEPRLHAAVPQPSRSAPAAAQARVIVAHQPLPQSRAPAHQVDTSGDRRASKKWTAEETEALLAGIEAHHYSNWKKIQVLPIFHNNVNRTTVDLKDKWRLLRNMVLNNTVPRAWPEGLDLDQTRSRIWRIIHENEPHLRQRVPNGILDDSQVVEE